MTERKPNSLSPCEQQVEAKKRVKDQAKLTTINLPSNFPFQNLNCLDEHEKIFKDLFDEN